MLKYFFQNRVRYIKKAALGCPRRRVDCTPWQPPVIKGNDHAALLEHVHQYCSELHRDSAHRQELSQWAHRCLRTTACMDPGEDWRCRLHKICPRGISHIYCLPEIFQVYIFELTVFRSFFFKRSWSSVFYDGDISYKPRHSGDDWKSWTLDAEASGDASKPLLTLWTQTELNLVFAGFYLQG